MGSRLESGSKAVQKRIANHVFQDEEGEEYGASGFGGFGDYFRRKKIKLQNLDAEIRSSSPNNPPIFRGVVAYVNGYTQPSLGDLHQLIVSYGGGFLQYLDGKTAATHIIASSLTPKKREEFRKYRIVKPAWVVESVKAGRLLPWDSFRVIDEGSSQKVLKFGDDGRVTNQANSQQRGYRDQTDASWYTTQIREGVAEDHGQLANDSTPASMRDNNLQLSSQDETKAIPAEPGEEGVNTVLSTHIPNKPGNTISASIHEKESTIDAESPADHAGAESGGFNKLSNRHEEAIRIKIPMTSEEYNAQLLSNPHLRNSSVVNPDFIQQYYRESRLHHLSTWKAELKAQLQATAQAKALTQKLRKQRAPGARRYILHVDFDSFFVAVSLQKHPDLAEKPVAVAHGTGPGSEISSCNYPARAFGIKNGMWMKGALEVCPELKVLPYDFPAYEDASRKFYDAILAIYGVVQSVSIDEALVDISALCLESGGSDGKGIVEGSIWREQAKADEVAQQLRCSIKEKTGCTVSIGIGGNILQAKMALRKAKPAGQFQLKPEGVLDFIGDLTVQDLPGVAYSLGHKLEELGVKFVKDIRELTKEKLATSLGPKTGTKLWEYARGIDHAEVGDQVMRKSVSAEINWGIRFVNQTQAEEFVQSLCDELHRRLVENMVKGKQLTMRIMRRSADAPLEPVKHLGHGKCDVFNKSVALGVATNASDIIGKEAISTLRSFNFSPGDLRGLGVQMTKLEPIKQTPTRESESSQRQLQFKAASPETVTKTVDPDEVESPKKGDKSSSVSDSIRDGPSLNDGSEKPLNIAGTQFILPTQADPKVLAELPTDIRSKFVSISKAQNSGPSRTSSSITSPRPQSPFVTPDLPPQSQLDPDALDALPEDVRAEVLSYYQQGPRRPLLSSSTSSRPRPPSGPKKVTVAATKPRAGKGRGRSTAKSIGNPTLTQSSFILTRPLSSASNPMDEASTARASPAPDVGDGISPDFLAALPEDIRQEVLEEHRRSRLLKRAGLSLPPNRRPLVPKNTTPMDPKRLRLPPRPEKPTFTSKKLSSLPELRDALAEWYTEFETDGPYEEDVDALLKYLRRVILEEKDIAKAVSVADWLTWLIERSGEGDIPGASFTSTNVGSGSAVRPLEAWWSALQDIRHGISDAVITRGLPPVEFT